MCGFVKDAFAGEKITVSSSAVGFTAATFQPTTGGGADRVLVTVEDQPVRLRYDGTSPTASVGHLLQPGDSITLTGTDSVANAEFIRSGGTDGVIFVTFER